MKSTFSYDKDEQVYRQGKAATYLYQVISGAIRTSSKLADGRRQIGAFYFPGDIFGLETSTCYRWGAEAIVTTTTVRRVRQKTLLRKARSNLSLARGVLNIAERDLVHAEDHRLLLGHLLATERVSAFILQMNNRIGVKGEIDLPMNREDVGDPSSNGPLTVDLFRKDLREKPSCRRAVGLPHLRKPTCQEFPTGERRPLAANRSTTRQLLNDRILARAHSVARRSPAHINYSPISCGALP